MTCPNCSSERVEPTGVNMNFCYDCKALIWFNTGGEMECRVPEKVSEEEADQLRDTLPWVDLD
jgi:hypothetical protein